jgi:hypothetical protein
MLAFTSFAFADSVTVMVGQQSAIATGADSNAYRIGYTKTLTKSLKHLFDASLGTLLFLF